MNNNLTYTRCGDYEIPNLTLSETENKPLGKYGRMRKRYLQEHSPVLWNSASFHGTAKGHTIPKRPIYPLSTSTSLREFLSATELILR